MKKMKKMKKISIILLISPLILFISFSIFQIDKIEKIPITGYFINPNAYSSFFSDSKKVNFTIEQIEKKIEENQQTIANLILTGISFSHKRSLRIKGFEVSTDFKKEFIKYKLEPYSIYSENGYFVSKTSLITITDYIKNRLKRITQVNGILTQADASLSLFDNVDSIETITEDVIFEALKECIINAVIKAYGNNYLFEINGYINLTQPPEYRFANSLIYVRVKGYVIFYSFTR